MSKSSKIEGKTNNLHLGIKLARLANKMVLVYKDSLYKNV